MGILCLHFSLSYETNTGTKQNLQLQFVPEQSEVVKQIDQIDKDTMLAETVTPSFDRTVCPKCKNDFIREIPRIRSPPRLHAVFPQVLTEQIEWLIEAAQQPSQPK